MGKRSYHDKPEVDHAIKGLVEERGWRLEKAGHLYHLLCPCGEDYVRVDSTPRNPGNHAKRILRQAAYCPDKHGLSPQPTPRGRRGVSK